MANAGAVIILNEKKIFLQKRSNYTKVFPLCWIVPRGRSEENETPEETVIREVKEETNLKFTPTKLYDQGTWKDRTYFRYLGESRGEIKIQEKEVLDFGWFSYKEAKKLKLAFDYDEIIEQLYGDGLIK